MSALSFSVRLGIPGSLTIEMEPVTSRPIPVRPVNLYPPLPQAVLGRSGIADSEALMSKAWGEGWAVPMSNRLKALGGDSLLQLLTLECPSLDQTDNTWGATATIDATTDPITITAVPFGTSNFGRVFAAGDYILWDDPSIVSGHYQYEIDRIASLKQNTFTLERANKNSTPGRAQFDSFKGAHAGIKFYQLVLGDFNVLWDGTRQVYKFLWDNMIVAAVSATTVGM